jgi:CO dehydrogenase maturation factor
MVRALVSHLLLRERETVLMDMVAGLEHLGRGTAASVDAMFIVVEPGQRSLTVAADIGRLARELGIPAIWAVGNKVRSEQDLEFIRQNLGDLTLGGWLPRDDRVMEADMQGAAVYDLAPELAERVRTIARVSGLLLQQE